MSNQLNNEKYNVLEDPLDTTNQSEKQKEMEAEKQHIVMPMNIEYNTQKPLPEDLKEFLSDFTKLKSSLNCWTYVCVVFIVLTSLGMIRFVFNIQDIIQVFKEVSTLLDYVFWLVGLKKGRKTCNDFKLDEIQKLPRFIKISQFIATLNLIAFLHSLIQESMQSKYFNTEQGIWLGIVIIFNIIFLIARFHKHINPAIKINKQIKQFSLQYPENTQGFTLLTVLRQHIPYKN